MCAVKPYYVSGYKNRIFYRFSKVINTIFTYKILPFLPVVLFVLYPLFFNVKSVIDKMQTLAPLPLYLIVFITIIWWIIWLVYCKENFSMEWLLKLFKEYKEEKDLSMSILVLVTGVILLVGLLMVSFYVGLMVIVISDVLTMLISINETISFYIVTLPIASLVSYLILHELKSA